MHILKKKDGMTLIEVIISMAILGIIMLMIFSFMDFGMKSFTMGVEEARDQSNLRLTMLKVVDSVRNSRHIEVVSNTASVTLGEYIYLETDGKLYHVPDKNVPSDKILLSSEDINTVSFGLVKDSTSLQGSIEISLTGNSTLETNILLNNIFDPSIVNGVVVGFDHIP